MPLQTVFRDKVTAKGTTQLYPLGTIRIEGSKRYKYVKSSGVITAKGVCSIAAAGTVVLFAANIKGCGFNATGAATADGEYFWMQTHGEVGSLDTNTGMTAVGYPVGVTEADGVTLADPGVGIVQLGNCSVVVKHASAGIIALSGLA